MTDIGAVREPIVWTVREGLVDRYRRRPRGGTAARAHRRRRDATNIGELGIGLNPTARITHDITETKKRLGTAHFALGDNAGGYGGVVVAPSTSTACS